MPSRKRRPCDVRPAGAQDALQSWRSWFGKSGKEFAATFISAPETTTRQRRRSYTDMGLFTCREDIADDVSDLFNYLTGYSRQTSYRKLLVSPVNLRQGIASRIEREIDCARRFGSGRLNFKCKSLVDP